jgi:hypothetical protein
VIHLVDELAELALWTMGTPGRAEAQRHLDRCARCRSELALHRELLAALGLALRPEPPAPSTRERLLRDAALPGPSAFADLRYSAASDCTSDVPRRAIRSSYCDSTVESLSNINQLSEQSIQGHKASRRLQLRKHETNESHETRIS